MSHSEQTGLFADLLFELGTEELPPLALTRLADALANGIIEGLDQVSLSHADVQVFATPRRLAVLIPDCQTRQADQSLQRKGPAVKAAFDADGNPTRAATGFASSCGLSVDQLQTETTNKGEWLVAMIDKPGQTANELLPEIASRALDKLPIPKRMRWGASDVQFVRPVHWLVFLLGDAIVDCNLLGISAGRQTYGHRFHAPAAITLNSASEYLDKLNDAAFVIPDFSKRREVIRQQVIAEATRLGSHAELDDALLDEVTALNEWPTAISGGFDAEFLEVPQEALILTMKKNQKYFPLLDDKGALLNHFITIANIESKQPEVIAAGNERVIRPRLADAKFFWEKDAATTLEQRLEALKDVVFQKSLGSLYDKSARVAATASSLANALGGDAALCKRAGLLSRTDLNTEMVLEFASMQGIMGRYQAQRDGETDELATAMDEFYMPRYSGDQLPQTPTGIAIALADRMDTLLGIFAIGMKPTGDKDPFGLRRSALGILRILKDHALNINLATLLEASAKQLSETIDTSDILGEVHEFLIERLKGIYKEEGIDSPMFDAVAASKPLTITDFDQRITAIKAFNAISESADLAAANKRIRNILRKSESEPVSLDPDLLKETAELELASLVSEVALETGELIEQRNYTDCLLALAKLKPPVDAFFDNVMVMDDDPNIRGNRLALLSLLSDVLSQVADISQLSR